MSNVNQVTVLMTALVPTIGHYNLVKFAINFAKQFENPFVKVIISSRSFEPVSGAERVHAFRREFGATNIYFQHHDDDKAPQNPSTDDEWKYWARLIGLYDGAKNHYIIGSEPYCQTLANYMNGEFIPYDMDRTIVNTKGTKVRNDRRYDDVMDTFKPYFQKRVTFFGQESVGKTTLSRAMHKSLLNYKTSLVTEFARPYLEYQDEPSVTDIRMQTIMCGQYALQKSAPLSAEIILQDTDLLSTIGYYRLWNKNSKDTKIFHEKIFPIINKYFEQTKSDLYIVMNDNIPFEEDPLRYGGNKRETTRQFWIDLLEEFGCNYYLLQSSEYTDRINEAHTQIVDLYNEKWNLVSKFERD